MKWTSLYEIAAASRTHDQGATAPRSLSSVLNWICWTPPPRTKFLCTPLGQRIYECLNFRTVQSFIWRHFQHLKVYTANWWDHRRVKNLKESGRKGFCPNRVPVVECCCRDCRKPLKSVCNIGRCFCLDSDWSTHNYNMNLGAQYPSTSAVYLQI